MADCLYTHLMEPQLLHVQNLRKSEMGNALCLKEFVYLIFPNIYLVRMQR